MKYFLTFLFVLFGVAYGQLNLIPNTQKLYTIGGRSVLIWTPADTTRPLHLLVSFVGNGTNDSAACVNQGPAKRIRVSTTGVHRDSFLVVTYIRHTGSPPEENGSVSSLNAIDGVLTPLFNNCTFLSTTDSTRNAMTGLSQGCQETMRYLSDWGIVFVGYNNLHRTKFSREVHLSNGSTDGITGGSATTRGTSGQYIPTGSRQWYGSLDVTTGTVYPNDLHTFQASYNAFPKSMIDTIVGAAHDNTVWDSAWNLNATTALRNSWLWLLSYSYGLSNTPPVANAGANQTLAFGTTSTTLDGSASTDPDGTITTYAWTKIFGGSATIVSASSAVTNITGMSNGSYQFKLTVTDNNAATSSDTVNVIIVANRHQLTMSKERVYKRNGLPDEVLAINFVDNDTLTPVCSGIAQAVISNPNHLWYELPNDSVYNNLTFEVFNGAASPGSLSFTLFTADFSDSVVVSKTMVTNSWNWVDTNTTKAFVKNFKYIRYNLVSCASNTTELRVFATNQDTATWRIPYVATVVDSFYTFAATAAEGSESDTLFNSVGFIRTFQERWYRDSTMTYDSAHRTLVGSVYPGSPLTYLQSYRTAGKKMMFAFEGSIRAFQTPPPSDPTNYGSFDVNVQNRLPLSDSTVPYNWLPSAQESYLLAAWTGRNASASYGPHTLKDNLGVSLTKGQNLVDIFETTNEWNAYWSTKRYHNAQVRAARLSAEADGHMNTMGTYVGVKNADPTMKIYSGALVSYDSVELKSDAFYTYKLRGRNNDPRDGVVINQYFVYGGSQGTGVSGISPGQMNWWTMAQSISSLRDRYFAGRRIGIGEFGWDKRQNTQYSAIAHAPYDSLTVQANWILQAYHIARAAGIDFMCQYKSKDDAALTSIYAGGFGTSGQFSGYSVNPDSNYKRWPANFWGSTMMAMCQRYNTVKPTMVLWGDSTSLTHVRYDAQTGTDTVTSVVWMGTNNGSFSTVTLTASGNVTWAEAVTNVNGDKDGVHTPLTPSGTSIPVGSVGENPVYVRYVMGGITPASIQHSRYRLRNIP